jgi:hypothetical protein
MKLLLIGNEITFRENITCYSDMQSFYLSKALRDMNVSVSYASSTFTDAQAFVDTTLEQAKKEKVNHIIALGVRFFHRNSHKIGAAIQKEFPGLVCQIHDGSLLDDFPVDLNFCIKDDEYRYLDNENNRLTRHKSANYYIGWAADSSMFYPAQASDGTLRVFVDHSTFSDNSSDYSLNVLMSLIRLKQEVLAGRIEGFKDLHVRTLTNRGLEDIDLDHIFIEPYNRYAVSANDFSAELRQSHVFMVTHNESVGLCVLEAAMSGCAVFIPKGTIAQDLVNCVRGTEFTNSVNWEKLSSKINPELNSLYVQKFNWQSVAHNIVRGLISFNKRQLPAKFSS